MPGRQRRQSGGVRNALLLIEGGVGVEVEDEVRFLVVCCV